MPADRQAIERRDFPLVRRGYDTAAVDAHLAAVADRVEALEREVAEAAEAARAVASPASVGRAASEQVRGIVEAAERSAADIERAAREDAERIRAEAARDVERLRAEVAERLRGLLARVEGMEEDVQGLEAPAGTAPTPSSAPPSAPPPAPASAPPPAPSSSPLPPADGEADEEGARIVALEMALSGRSREEADRYLREHFEVADRERLLDEVWASVGS